MCMQDILIGRRTAARPVPIKTDPITGQLFIEGNSQRVGLTVVFKVSNNQSIYYFSSEPGNDASIFASFQASSPYFVGGASNTISFPVRPAYLIRIEDYGLVMTQKIYISFESGNAFIFINELYLTSEQLQ